MSEEPKYTHISVSSDEDEVVIQAGAYSAPADDAKPQAGILESSRAKSLSPDGNEGSATSFDIHEASTPSPDDIENRVLVDAGLTDEDISEEARKEYEHHMRVRQARQQALQMETTEEDLHVKMPFVRMQRGIVAALVLLAIAAALYWFVQHPIL